MAAPRYRGYESWNVAPVEVVPARPQPGVPPSPQRHRRSAGQKQRDAMRRRRFVFLVVAPVLLMLGSVYLHTVAAGVNERITTLEEGISANEVRAEDLRVEAAELSGPERIQQLAAEQSGLKPAGSDDFVVDGGREDGRDVVSQGETE